MREAFADSSAQDLVALALEGYAELGDRHVKELAALGFDSALLTEARTLAAALRARRAERLTTSAQSSQREALSLRSRLASLLIERMRAARSAARYVFRHHPEIARKATSGYERKRRARQRSAAEASAVESRVAESLAPAASGVCGLPAKTGATG